MRTLVIAEAGVNHNGDIQLARELIDHAAAAGADLVKFQTFSADRLVTRTARKARYQAESTDAEESQYEMLRKLELTPSMHEELIAHCGRRGIGFFSTGFDLESLDLLAALGLQRFKVPSGELTNLPYLRRIASFGKPLIISTGMASQEETGSAIRALEAAGMSRSQITVLHCTTEYPTPMVDVNLRAMSTIAEAFGVSVGYSDHTVGFEVPIAAVALGASVIEKHFTLDRSLPGPDHKASLEPSELRAMVAAIRNIEVALGDGLKRPRPSESANAQIARKSIVASRNIAKGDRFTEENLTVKRPGTGVSPMRWDEVIGRIATRSYARDELIDS